MGWLRVEERGGLGENFAFCVFRLHWESDLIVFCENYLLVCKKHYKFATN